MAEQGKGRNIAVTYPRGLDARGELVQGEKTEKTGRRETTKPSQPLKWRS